MLVGSLKGSDLYRFAMHDGQVAERETVIEDLARIRDIEIGPAGRIFILLEHEAGSLIVPHGPGGGRMTSEARRRGLRSTGAASAR